MASAGLQRKGIISFDELTSFKEITLFFEGLLKPNYCSQFDEILHEKIGFQDLFKTFIRINLSLLETENQHFLMLQLA